jgi:hypothetical protein
MTLSREPRLSIDAFEAGTIDSAEFDHAAHIYVAWLYLQRFPAATAISRFTQALRRLTARLGVPGKYHATISWFYMLLIAERLTNASTKNWNEFRQDNDDLFRRDDNVLARYYSDNLLSSDLARQSFVLPDKLVAQAA